MLNAYHSEKVFPLLVHLFPVPLHCWLHVLQSVFFEIIYAARDYVDQPFPAVKLQMHVSVVGVVDIKVFGPVGATLVHHKSHFRFEYIAELVVFGFFVLHEHELDKEARRGHGHEHAVVGVLEDFHGGEVVGKVNEDLVLPGGQRTAICATFVHLVQSLGYLVFDQNSTDHPLILTEKLFYTLINYLVPSI